MADVRCFTLVVPADARELAEQFAKAAGPANPDVAFSLRDNPSWMVIFEKPALEEPELVEVEVNG